MCLLVAIACVAAASLSAQTPVPAQPAPAGRIIGVYDATTGDPLPGVRVRDVLTGTSATTSNTGAAQLDFLSYRGNAALVQLMKLGYEAKTILIARDDTTSVTEVLQRATVLPPVVTTETYRIARDAGRRDGFERRCQQPLTTCFRENDFASHPADNIADFLVRARGVTIGACSNDPSRSTQCGRFAMRSSVIPPPYCEPSIFIDGFLWNPTTGSAIDMKPHAPPVAPFTPTNVESIEVYPTNASRPLRFEGDPFCGAIVIWTK